MLLLLLGLSVILLPFNSVPYFQDSLREMAGEGAFYPMALLCIGSILLFFKGERFYIPKHSTKLLLYAFLLWVVVSSLFNLPSIFSAEIKGRTGEEKLIFQSLLLMFVISTSFITFNISRRVGEPLPVIRKYILMSFLIAGFYSVFEIASLLGSPLAMTFLETINPFIRQTSEASDLAYVNRLRSVSGEASYFATYCSFAFPWILSYAFTERKGAPVYLAISAYFVLLLVLTWSRTAYVITAIQIALFMIGLGATKSSKNNFGRVFASFFIIGMSILVGTSFFSGNVLADRSLADVFLSLLSLDNLSNISRMGSQVTAYTIALSNPIFGVGLGQYGFHMSENLPDWALASWEVRAWASNGVGTPWPPVHAIYARIAAELGFIGLAIWAILWLKLLKQCHDVYKERSATLGHQDIHGLTLSISIIGVLLSGFNLDTFRFFGYWILLGLTWDYILRNRPTECDPHSPGFNEVSTDNSQFVAERK